MESLGFQLGGDTSPTLLEVSVPLMDGCGSQSITEHMICAGYLSGGYDSCQVSSKFYLIHAKHPVCPRFIRRDWVVLQRGMGVTFLDRVYQRFPIYGNMNIKATTYMWLH